MSLTVSTCLHRCFDDAFERNGNNYTTIISVINVNNNIFINNSNITIIATVDNRIFTVKNNTKTFDGRGVGELR